MKLISKLINPNINEGFVRVGFATKDKTNVNEHFGKAYQFIVFDVSANNVQLAGHVRFNTELDKTECNPENKHFEKVKALNSCHMIYSQSIGGPAAANLTQNKIHPLVVKNNPDIEALIHKIQIMLNGVVPPWLRKIVQVGV